MLHILCLLNSIALDDQKIEYQNRKISGILI
jgi:hypothetical protein